METTNKLTEKLTKIISDDETINKYDNIPASSSADYMTYHPNVVGYNSTAEQQYIFENLLVGYHPDHYSILDIGCGRADLYGYLRESYEDSLISYQGLGTFGIAELKPADWVVACGFFTPRRCETEDEDLQQLFKDVHKMYELANNCVSFNLLSPIGNDLTDGFLYVHPGLVMDMLIEQYKYVTVRNNYANDVYTVTIYKF
jgi:hypothetical protein